MKSLVCIAAVVGSLFLAVDTAHAADHLLDTQSDATMVKTVYGAKPVLAQGNAFVAKELQVIARTVNVLMSGDGKPTTVLVEPTVERTSPAASQAPASPARIKVMELSW